MAILSPRLARAHHRSRWLPPFTTAAGFLAVAALVISVTISGGSRVSTQRSERWRVGPARPPGAGGAARRRLKVSCAAPNSADLSSATKFAGESWRLVCAGRHQERIVRRWPDHTRQRLQHADVFQEFARAPAHLHHIDVRQGRADPDASSQIAIRHIQLGGKPVQALAESGKAVHRAEF